jgi:tRNA-splicing ligase RtcB
MSRDGAVPAARLAQVGRQMNLVKIHDYLWEIPKTGAMLVPGRIYISEPMLEEIRDDPALLQVANVACLPGIVGYSLAMPDIHWGYGFPIGGVAGIDADRGVISPGGVGYDINCGVRLARTNLSYEEVAPKVDRLADALFEAIPAGVGSQGAIPNLSVEELRQVVREGAQWALSHGYAVPEDLEHTEENGCLPMAQPEKVSEHAYNRGRKQLGTLGSGNHFLEVSRVDHIYEPQVADALGIRLGQVTVLIHSGSRGLGHQTCDDYLRIISSAMSKYEIVLPDRQLAAVPICSPEGQDYLGAMAAAANFAWCNRQVMMHLAANAFMAALGIGRRELGFTLIYDVCHNIAKFEEHSVGGKTRKLWVHRKGATRAFPPGHPEVPAVYRQVGQPVIIPGDMGRASWVLVGQPGSMQRTFGTTCHGAGRAMSRTAAIKDAAGRRIDKELEARGVVARAQSRKGLAEEQPRAYKNVDDVVEVVDQAGLSRKVARMRPLGVIKG